MVKSKKSNETRSQFLGVHLLGKVLCQVPDIQARLVGRGWDVVVVDLPLSL